MFSFVRWSIVAASLFGSVAISADGVRWKEYQQCFALRASYGRVSGDKGIFLPSPLRDGVYWYGTDGRVYEFPFQSRCWQSDGNGGDYCSFDITVARRQSKTFRIYRKDGQPDAIVEHAADGHEKFYLVESGHAVPTIEANQILQHRLIHEFAAIRQELDADTLDAAGRAERQQFISGCAQAISGDYSIGRMSGELLPRLQEQR